MGTVYAARHEGGDFQHAVKIVRLAGPDREQRFLREAETLARLNHPGVVRVHQATLLPGGIGLISMDMIEGRNLQDLLEEQGRFPWKRVLEIALQLAQALEKLHAAGVVHRDLKPANLIQRVDTGCVVLCDFGVVRDMNASRMTQSQQALIDFLLDFSFRYYTGGVAREIDEIILALGDVLPGDPRPGWTRTVILMCRSVRMEPQEKPSEPSDYGRMGSFNARWHALAWSMQAKDVGRLAQISPAALLKLAEEPLQTAQVRGYTERHLVRKGHKSLGQVCENRLRTDRKPSALETRRLWAEAVRHHQESLRLREEERGSVSPWERAELARCLLLGGRTRSALETLEPRRGRGDGIRALFEAECALVEGDLAAARRAAAPFLGAEPQANADILVDCLALAGFLHARGNETAKSERAFAEIKGRAPFLSWRTEADTRAALEGRDPRQPLWVILNAGD